MPSWAKVGLQLRPLSAAHSIAAMPDTGDGDGSEHASEHDGTQSKAVEADEGCAKHAEAEAERVKEDETMVFDSDDDGKGSAPKSPMSPTQPLAPIAATPKAKGKGRAKKTLSPKHSPKRQRAATRASAKAGGKGAGRNNKVCSMCRSPDKTCVGKDGFCRECKTEYEACRKDAIENGWLQKFQKCQDTPVLMRKLVSDFKHQCPSRGRGQRRKDFDSGRCEEIFQRATMTQRGVEKIFMDWFDYELYLQNKKIPDSEIERRWRDLLAAADDDDKDRDGENAEFPDRVAAPVKDYKNEFKQQAEIEQVVRASTFKKDKASEEFDKYKAEMQDDDDTAFVNPSPGKKARVGPGPAASSSSPQAQKGAQKGEDVGIARLRAYDEQVEVLKYKVQPSLVRAAKSAKEMLPEVPALGAQDSTEVSVDDEYLEIVKSRLALVEMVTKGYHHEVPPSVPPANQHEVPSSVPPDIISGNDDGSIPRSGLDVRIQIEARGRWVSKPGHYEKLEI